VEIDDFGMEAEAPVEKTFRSQVTSLVFWLCAIFTTLNLFRVNYYIGTVGEQLLAFTGDLVVGVNATVSDNELKAEFFTEMFAYFLPLVGVASVPVIGILLDRMGLLLSIWVLVASGVLYAIFSLLLFMPIEVQLITFIFVAFFRALLFSVMATYVAVEFSFAHFGKLWGIVFLMGGIVNLGEYVMTVAAHGEYFWINVVMMALSLLCIVFPLYLVKHPPPDMTGPAVH
jgi:MFS family permease